MLFFSTPRRYNNLLFATHVSVRLHPVTRLRTPLYPLHTEDTPNLRADLRRPFREPARYRDRPPPDHKCIPHTSHLYFFIFPIVLKLHLTEADLPHRSSLTPPILFNEDKHLFLFTEHTARFSTEQDDLRTINGTNRDSPLSRTSNQYRHTPV